MDKKIKFSYDILNIEKPVDLDQIIENKPILDHLILYCYEEDILDYFLEKNTIKGVIPKSSNIIIDLENRKIIENYHTNLKGIELSVYTFDVLDSLFKNHNIVELSESKVIFSDGKIKKPEYSKQVIRYITINQFNLTEELKNFLIDHIPDIDLNQEYFNLNVHFKYKDDNTFRYYLPVDNIDFIKKVLGKPFLLDVNSKPLKYYSNFKLVV